MNKKKILSRRKFILNSASLVIGGGFIGSLGVITNTKNNLWSDKIKEPVHTDLFISGKQGYPRYRITSLVVTNSGTVVAITQGRHPGGDNAQNDIVLRRSDDGGVNWEPMQVIAEDGDRALTPHCSVVDRETGRIILITGSFPDGCHAGCVEPGFSGEKNFKIYQIHSDDDGKTWSKKRDITRMVKLPSPFELSRSGSGMGIQLKREPYKGRIIMPTNNRYDQGGSEVSAVYSDDHGETWQHGKFVSKENVDSGPNETQMVELADGTVMLNTRARNFRKIAYSYDGGETWTPLENEPQLIESGCNASIIRYSDPLDGEKSRLLFSNPATQSKREKGTIRLSYDEGKTWPVKKMFYRGDFGYSSMARLPNGDIGILFERDKVKRGVWRAMTFSRFSIEWLTDGEDSGIQ